MGLWYTHKKPQPRTVQIVMASPHSLPLSMMLAPLLTVTTTLTDWLWASCTYCAPLPPKLLLQGHSGIALGSRAAKPSSPSRLCDGRNRTCDLMP